MERVVVAGLLALGACGDNSGEDGAHSGTRLKIVDWVFDDGTRQWNGFHDMQRQEDCGVAGVWDDGKYYCTPGTEVGYADATCTQPIILGTTNAGYQFEATPCGRTVTHLYEVGSPITLPRFYVQSFGGPCSGPITVPTQTLFAIGAEVPRAQLAELTPTAPSGSGRVQTSYLTSSDGLRFPWSLHDQQLGVDCVDAWYFDGQRTTSCVPDASQANFARDASCNVRPSK